MTEKATAPERRIQSRATRRGVAVSGFTLIELMIVVAIVAILASIAYPAFTNSVLKGKRSEGRAALLGLMQQEERYFTQFNCYVSFSAAGATDCSGASVTPIPFRTTSGDGGSTGNYTLKADPCPNTTLSSCVLLTAVPNFTDSAVGNLTLQSTGAKSCSGTNATICWGTS